jgi:hypothetical protein
MLRLQENSMVTACGAVHCTLCLQGCVLLVADVLQVGSAFLTLGLQPKDRVGVFGANSPEWMLAMQGCNRTRCVPLRSPKHRQATVLLGHCWAKQCHGVDEFQTLPALLSRQKARSSVEGHLYGLV